MGLLAAVVWYDRSFVGGGTGLWWGGGRNDRVQCQQFRCVPHFFLVTEVEEEALVAACIENLQAALPSPAESTASLTYKGMFIADL